MQQLMPLVLCAEIRALRDDVQPAVFSIQSDICMIGRHQQCDIVIQRDTISRLHARIERRGPDYVLCDNKSVNGTFVNGRQIQEPHLLQVGDRIGLAKATPLLYFVDPERGDLRSSRLSYNERAKEFSLGQQRVSLAPTQFRLLLHLYRHAGVVCTRESCVHAIWGDDYISLPGLQAETLDRAVNILKNKLRELDPLADLIKTFPGVGYELTSSS